MSGFLWDQRKHLTSHYWGIKEAEREVKSDVLRAEEWRAEQGLASQSKEGASMPQPPEVRAQDSRWPVTLICTSVASLITGSPTLGISLTSTWDSFKNKARNATPPTSRRWVCFSCEERHLMADCAHEGKTQGRGEGAHLPGGRLTSFPRSQNGKISSRIFPCGILMLLCLTLSFNWSSGTRLLGWDWSKNLKRTIQTFPGNYIARESRISAFKGLQRWVTSNLTREKGREGVGLKTGETQVPRANSVLCLLSPSLNTPRWYCVIDLLRR